MGNKKNVLIGSAALSISKDGTTWIDSGYTKDGVSFDYEPTYSDVEVDQELLPVKKQKTGQKILVQTNLAESTLENFKLAMGLPDSALTTDATAHKKTLDLVVSFDIPEVQLKLVGKSPDNLDRTVTLSRVVSIGKVSTKYSKKDPQTIPVQFEALSNDGASYGSIVDNTPAA